MKKVLFVFGTRPEAIKMAPLVHTLGAHPDQYAVTVCVTAQHRQMLDQVLDFFDIKPDYDLNLMRPDQTLFDLTAASLTALGRVLGEVRPDLTLVQGDTTTAFTGALASFYHKVPVGHVEAGLRSGNKHSPFPEENNRILAGHIADLHFAPTPAARDNLAREGITERVYVTGNTVIDALFLCLRKLKKRGDSDYLAAFPMIDFGRRLILVTGHRRESFGDPFRQMCLALRDIVRAHPDVEVVYPVHLNPNVQAPVHEILAGEGRVHLIAPLDYPALVWLMSKSYLVLTDSGGIQEEAPSLGKPILVMREVTERVEGIEAGTARLVGTDLRTITDAAAELLLDQSAYDRMAQAVNPYGDGTACLQIERAISGWWAV